MLNLKYMSNLNKSSEIFYCPSQLGYKNLKLQYQSYVIDKNHKMSKYVSEIFEIKNIFKNGINVIPDGCNDIIIIYNENNIYSYLSPTLKNIENFLFSNKYTILGIRFLPGATANILKEDMCNILESTPRLNYFLDDFNKIEYLIMKSTSFKERCKIIVSYLAKKIEYKDSKQLIINHSINKIILSKGNYNIEDLSKETGYSSRYIRKLFKSYVGHNPKELSNIIRIQNMINYIYNNSVDNLSYIALECGFADQSHMNRESKRYLNTTVGDIKNNSEWINNLSVKLKRSFF